MNDITDQKRLQLAYKKILQLEEKVKTQTQSNEINGNGRDVPVAVIGAACRYPGGIDNIQTLWDSFANNINVVREIPKTRWDLKEIFSENKNDYNKTYCRYGAFFDEIDQFDPLFFNISNKEAERMDPQQRLFLQGCWEAFEDAGYNDSRLNGIKCGVYAGALNCDYSNVLNATPHHADMFELIGTQASILSARISYLLNLKGPSITIDTACSSSLVAIDLAVKAIQRGDIDLALAGGVHLYITPNLYIMMSKGQMLSIEGQSKAFDNNANGFSPGEGMAVVTLKALDKAIADGDQIYGVILGGASNQDGKTNGITAPSSLAQAELELEAYNKLNINPETIGYVEAHGTGTKLGDPIEFEALSKSFGHFTQKQKFCALGSSKTNFGHTLAAAGVTGVLKALLAMRHKKIPANLNFTQVNEHLDYDNSPFYINNTLVDWQPDNGPRRSAVNSFGISGTNVHLILEEAPEISVNHQASVPPSFLILLSGKTQTALQRKVNDLIEWMDQPVNTDARLTDIALTLMRGRSHFKYRSGFVVSSKIALQQQLEHWSPPATQAGGAFGTRAEINALIHHLKLPANDVSNLYSDSLTTLLKHYINGGKGDWWQLLDNAGARTISLPNYPYEMEKYWISADTTLAPELNNSTTSFSLVDSNESTLESQCYQKTFTGNEFYLKDHVVNLRKMLPGVAYLEMARSSGNLCNHPHKVTRIQNVTWKSPIVVDGGPQTVKISLHPDGDHVGFQIFSTNDGNSKSTVHATGGLVYDPEPPQDEYIDVEALRAELNEFLSQKQCYETFNEKGLAYGSTFKRVLNLSYQGNRALATIEGLASDSMDDALHPGILDAALQAVLVLVSQVVEISSQHYLPYTVEQFEIRHPLTTRCHSFVTRREKISDDPDEYFDVKLTDEHGKVLLCVTGLKLVPVKQDSARLTRKAEQLYYSKRLIENSINTLSPDVVKNHFFSSQRTADNPAIIVVGNHQGTAQCVDEALLSQYLETIHVEQADSFQAYAKGHVQLDLSRPEHAELLLESLAANQVTPEYVLWLVPPIAELNHDQQIQQFQFMCRLAKHLIQYKTSRMLRLVTLEMSTAHELDSDSAFSGFFKTLAQENPNYIGKHLVFGTPLENSALTQTAINELFNSDFNSHPVLYKEGARFKKRLQKMDAPAFVRNAENSFFKEGGAYLITGGLHGVGLTLAHEISTQADAHLILLGRSAPTAQSQKQIELIQKNLDKGSLTVQQADVSNERDMQRVVDDIMAQHGKLNGILHCAGVKRDSFILKKTDQEIEAVLRPKVTGTLNIDLATKDIKLDFIVLFSSIASVFGNPGQSDYAFANGFMDDFAAFRNMLTAQGERSGHTLSINWPLWETGGMQLDEASFASMDELFGMRPIDGRLGLIVLETCLHAEKHSIMFMFGDQVKTEKSLRKGLADDRKELPSDITQLDNQQRDTVLRETERFVKLLISDEMKIPYEKLDSDAPFENFGMDSVVFMSLNQKLEAKFGKISKTLFYEYQNIGSLTDYFVENYLDQLLEITDIQFQGPSEPNVQPTPAAALEPVEPTQALPRFKSSPSATSALPTTDIAIIGVSGRYPHANNLQEFWRNLLDGKDCVEEIPLERWDHSRYFSSERGTPGKTYSKWGGFIDGHNSFDAFFFNISPKEAALIDPQERVFLETSWQAMADAGYGGKTLSKAQVGVYAGVMWNQYQLLGIDPEYAPDGGVPESLISSVANRVSYFFDFHGPSIGLDTMCSSSLTALHMACEAIRSGEIDYALAGGVNLIVHPSKYLRLAQGNFASSDGRCRSFGAGGDGYVPGEGVGVALLKPLDKAIADHDHIYGVIKSTHINHGGKTNGYTVPNPVQQGELIRHALKKANIHPESISYVEAHGTGTALGDPIEVTGLTQAYRRQTEKTGFCALGSVKASIGHLESAAGISALSKVILQFKHDMLVPTLHCQEENPNIDLESTPFVLQKEAQPWSKVMQSTPDIARDKRRAAISSFGAGGANAHLIIEEPPVRSVQSSPSNSDAIFTFSAKDNDRLKRYVLAFVAYLEQPDITTTVALTDIAYTLNLGRDLESERLAIVARSHQQLLASLQAYLEGKQQPETNWFYGDARRGQEQSAFLPTGDSGKAYIKSLLEHRELNSLAALWTQGADIDWHPFFLQNNAYRTPLPTAPFNRDIYWVDLNTAQPASAISGLHPLLDRNTSTLDQQTYAKTFTGAEPVIRDHRIGGNPILPAAGYVEMVRTAIRLAADKDVSQINHLQWHRPILIQAEPVNTELHLELMPKAVAFELVKLSDNGTLAVCCDGEVADNVESQTLPNRALSITDKLPNTISQQAFYQALNDKGFDYRNSFQSISEIRFDNNHVVATLAVPASNDIDTYMRSVTVLDAAFQSVVPLLDTQDATVYVPAKLESLSYHRDLTQAHQVRVKRNTASNEGYPCFDLQIVDHQGNVLCFIDAFTVAPFAGAVEKPAKDTGLHYFSTHWKDVEIPSSAVTHNSAPWVLNLSPQALSLEGIQLTPAPEFSERDRTHFSLNITHSESWQRLLAATAVAQQDIQLVLIAPNEKTHLSGFIALFDLFKALTNALKNRAVRLLLVHEHGSAAAALSGFIKTLDQEFSHITGLTVQVESLANSPAIQQAITAALTSPAASALATETRFANHQLSVKQALTVTADNQQTPAFKSHGVYWITGGASGIGRLVAQYLAENYQANIIITGRSALNDTLQKFIDSLRHHGSEALYLTADVSNHTEMTAVVEKSVARFGEINGIIHSAGITRDALLINKTAENFRQVVAPKIQGVDILDSVTANLHLDFLLLFSSISAVVGNPGQVDYATANSYLDQFASNRNRRVEASERQGKTVSINWPYWQSGGMQISHDIQQQVFASTGMEPLPTEEGMAALEFALTYNVEQLLVCKGHHEKILRTLNGEKAAPVTNISAAITGAHAGDAVTCLLRQIIAAETRWDTAKITDNESFSTYGIDSVMTLNLTRTLSETFGELPKTLFFEYTNIAQLCDYLVTHHSDALASLQGNAQSASKTINRPAPIAKPTVKPTITSRRDHLLSKTQGSEADESIAIIGLAGRYPKAASLQAFYQNLCNGVDAITEIPGARWDNAPYFDANRHTQHKGKSYGQWGGFIDGIDQFDPLFFNISPADAITIDPQERLFLESSWHTFEDAGYTREKLSGSNTGVFAGVMWSHYQLHGVDTTPTQGNKYPESSYSSIANRVSYFFELEGPSLAVDTMCSSSLTAINLACDALKRNDCSMAIAGGINLALHPYKYQQLSGSQFLSSDGRCRSFGEGGDGYVPGEGVGSVLLKPLSKAMADGDKIYGVIKGGALNHGGKSNGYNVPNPRAQAALIDHAITSAKVDASNISYIEAHGTGTPLGDPIELQGLKRAFSQHTSPQRCALGSVKSNIGHLEAASGIAALTKVLLQMQSHTLFPSLHADTLNPNLDFSGAPFRIQTELAPWGNQSQPLVAGISSFGAGGSNAFLLVESVNANSQMDSGAYKDIVFPLSAHNDRALQDVVNQLSLLLAQISEKQLPQSASYTVESLAYSLQNDRSAMTERLAIVASSLDDFANKLAATNVSQQQFPDGVYYSVADDTVRHQENAIRVSDNATDLARHWCHGDAVDFKQIYAKLNSTRLWLPPYPFSKKSYWYEGQRTHTSSLTIHQTASAPRGTLESTLDLSRSLQAGLQYKTQLHPDNALIKHHRFNDQSLLPGAAYIAMMAHTLKPVVTERYLKLNQLVWKKPLFVNQETRLFSTYQPKSDSRYTCDLWTGSPTHREEHASASIDVLDCSPISTSMISSNGDYTASIDKQHFYALFADYRIEYNDIFRCIQSARYNQQSAEVVYQVDQADSHTQLAILIDAALQSFVLLQDPAQPQAKLPFAIDNSHIHLGLTETTGNVPLTGRIHITSTRKNVGDAVVISSDGTPLVVLAGIQFRQFSQATVQQHAPSADLETRLTRDVLTIFRRKMNLTPSEITPKTAFDRIGLESVIAVDIVTELRALSDAIPSGYLLEHKSIASLVSAMLAEYGEDISAYYTDTETTQTTQTMQPEQPQPRITTLDLAAQQLPVLQKTFANAMAMSPDDVGKKVSFDKYGLESVKATEITRSLSSLYGDLPSTLLFEHHTLESLAQFLVDEKPEQCRTIARRSANAHPAERMTTAVHSATPPTPSLSENDLRNRVNQLTDSEVDSLLNNLLSNLANANTEQNSYES